MRSIKNLRNYPVTFALPADEITEFHAARLLLVLLICGKRGAVHGLTKLAKLDFFVRYPQFFDRVRGKATSRDTAIESPMIRYKYGPWDERYYQLLSYMESRSLLTIDKPSPKTFRFQLSPLGEEAAKQLSVDECFEPLVQHTQLVGEAFRSMSGNKLKEMIYREFGEEIVEKKMREVIS